MITEPGLRRPGFRLVKAAEKLAASAYSSNVSWRPEPFSGTGDMSFFGNGNEMPEMLEVNVHAKIRMDIAVFI